MPKFINKKFKPNIKPDIRYLKDMKAVIFNKEWLKKTSPDFETYYMHRGVYKNLADKKKMEKAGLRYDITIIPAKMFGREFPKTLGHYHSKIANRKSPACADASAGRQIAKLTYPEIYEVLSGKALYFFQKLKNGKITKALAIKAEKGDKIIVPPNYGHITINIGKTDLVMANWIAKEAKSDYKYIIRKKGGAYYFLKNDKGINPPTNAMGGNLGEQSNFKKNISHRIGGGVKWLKNKNYFAIPKIKFAKPHNYCFRGKKIIYDFVENLEELEFLKNPQKFTDLWKNIEK